MFGYSKLNPMYYDRPVTYISQARTGLVPKNNPEEHAVIDTDSVNILTLLKNQEMRDIVDMGGLDYGICFEDLIVQRLRFKNHRGGWNQKRQYTIRQLKDNHRSFVKGRPYEMK